MSGSGQAYGRAYENTGDLVSTKASYRDLRDPEDKLRDALRPYVYVSGVKTGKTYRLQRKLGEGGFGQVWLCKRSTADADKRCAVKIMLGPPTSTTVVREVEHMKMAVDAVGRGFVPDFYDYDEGYIDSPNPDADDLPQFSIIVMEYIDGVAANDLANVGLLPELRARVLLSFLAESLARLHERGVVHRDVKGENMLVGKNGRTYLCDFGCSGREDTPGGLNKVWGTLYFLAPEVAANGLEMAKVFRNYDSKIDIWSFGITAVYLAVGMTPWEDKILNEKLWAKRRQEDAVWTKQVFAHIARENVPDILEYSGFSWDYRLMVKQCLERDPAKRPTARQLTMCPALAIMEQDRLDFEDYMAEIVCNWEEAAGYEAIPPKRITEKWRIEQPCYAPRNPNRQVYHTAQHGSTSQWDAVLKEKAGESFRSCN